MRDLARLPQLAHGSRMDVLAHTCDVPQEKEGLKLSNPGIYVFNFSHSETSCVVLDFPLLREAEDHQQKIVSRLLL